MSISLNGVDTAKSVNRKVILLNSVFFMVELKTSILENRFVPNTRVTVTELLKELVINPYPTAFPYGNGMVLHFYQQQESSTTKTVHKVIKRLKTYV